MSGLQSVSPATRTPVCKFRALVLVDNFNVRGLGWPFGRSTVLGQGDHRAAKPWFGPQGRGIIDAGLDPLRRHFGTGINALVAVAIRYALQTAPNAIALIGFRTAEQIGACTRDLVPDLTQDEIALVRRVGQQMRAALDKAFGNDARQTTPAQPAKGKQ